MKTLNEMIKNPSGLDNYIGESNFPDFYVVLCQNRDSDRLTRSNFTSALEILNGENNDIIIHRFGHWACGWWEALTVKKDTKKYEISLNIEKNLTDYPVLDEDHYYTLEWDEALDYWNSLLLQEKIELCKEYNQSIFSARYSHIPENDRLEEYLKSE